jgi:signal transduction histidine kinase
VQLSGTEAGAIYVYSTTHDAFRMRASYGTSDALATEFRRIKIGLGETAIGEAAARREAVQVPDIADMAPSPVKDLLVRAGYKAILVVPLLRPDQVLGALVIRRKEPGAFPAGVVEVLSTFAAQSVLAIQNARLFSEIEEKGRQLAAASQHKSQFLANMSHELRTPLNAILGYTELILDAIYGDVPDKVRGVLERVQSNGKHLLGLINDVLDLSKIEAGQLQLTLQDYAVPTMIASVVAATESLARNKGLALRTAVAEGLPPGFGDERRLTQVLLNLVGNAVKFTDQGSVEILAEREGERFRLSVRDTGPGIAEADQARIFEEFQQVDNSNTRQKGGTGLGLAISRRIVALHGGTITVQSAPGAGSTFTIVVPIRAVAAKEAA